MIYDKLENTIKEFYVETKSHLIYLSLASIDMIQLGFVDGWICLMHELLKGSN